MIQVIRPSPQPPGMKERFAEAFGNLIGSGISAVGDYYSTKSQREAQQKAAEQQLMMQQLQGQQSLDRSTEVERLRQQGRQSLLQQKQELVNELLGGSRAPSQSKPRGIFAPELSEQEFLQGGLQGRNPDLSQLSEKDLLALAAIDPQMARLAQSIQDTSGREKRAEEEHQLRQERATPEYQRQEVLTADQARADIKYNQHLQELKQEHLLKGQSLDKLEDLNKKGVTGKTYEKWLEKLGLIALTSEGRREFAASVKNLLTGIRSILGSQFSQFEFQTILNTYPSADFSKEANAAIINNLKNFQDIKEKEFEFANELKKENKGQVPFDFQSRVNEKVQDYAQSRIADIKQNLQTIMNAEYGVSEGHTLMFSPQGEPMNVPSSKVAELLEQGASLP